MTCYIERTLQTFWIYYKIGILGDKQSPQSIVFRLYHQAKDHYKLTFLKLKHRIKVSSYLLMQMCPEEVIVQKIKLMNHFELMSLRVSLMEALQASEF